MRRHIPLNAVRAFEAAARHMSFARAADELCVTPTAVSHHVRSLEEFLQTELFERRNGRIALTPSALAAVKALTEGLDMLDAALAPLDRRRERQSVRVGVGPSFATLWLMPRLQRFLAASPQIDVKIKTCLEPANFDDPQLDLAIVNWTQYVNRKLELFMEEEVVPVCAPSIRPAGSGDDFSDVPLIHDDKTLEEYPTWQRYCEESHIRVADPSSGIRFNQSSLAIDAAIKGYGILLGRSRLVATALSERRLVKVGKAWPDRFRYYILRQPSSASKAARAFMDWLQQEAREEEPALAAA